MTDFAPIIIAVSTLVTSIGALVVAWRGSNKTDAVALKTDATLDESRKTTAKVQVVGEQTDGHMTAMREDLKAANERIQKLQTWITTMVDENSLVLKAKETVAAKEQEQPIKP